MSCYATDRMGVSIPDPSEAAMVSLLGSLAPDDPEHPDVALAHETGWCLTVFGSGRVILENVETGEGPWHRAGVTPTQTLELWKLLAAGETALVMQQPWQAGYGHEGLCTGSPSGADVNPYSPPTANLAQREEPDLAGLGLRQGFLFAIPFMVLAILFLLRRDAEEMAVMLPPVAGLILMGRWWALNQDKLENRTFLNKAALFGFILTAITIATFLLTHSYVLRHLDEGPLVGIVVLVFGFFTVYSLVLSMSIKSRIQKISAHLDVTPEP